MECRFTTQSIKVNKTLYRQAVEHPYDAEVILPDYYPDIHRILKCRVVAKIAQRNFENGRINVDGVICLNLIYSDRDCGIRSFEMQTPFSKTVDCSVFVSNGFVEAECRADYCNCKAINERQIDVHAAISVMLALISCEEVQVLADIDAPHVQSRRSVSPASSPFDRCEKYLLINDEVSLPDRCPAIRNILRHDLNVVINEKRIVGNKVVVKGEIIMDVLYFGEETTDCERFYDTISFNQVLELPNINESCTCSVKGEVISAELMPRTGMSGDMRVVSTSVKLLLCATAFCELDIPYITDAYSTKYDMRFEYNDVCFEKVAYSLNENFKLKLFADIPFSDEMRVVDVWCVPQLKNTARGEQGAYIDGNLLLCMIVKDKQGEPSYYERVFDFEKSFEMTLPDKVDFNCTVSPAGCAYNPAENGLGISVEFNVLLDVIEQNQCKVISSAELGDEHQRHCLPSSVVVYFAQDGESVWSIAQHYHTSVDAIVFTNGLKSDVINGSVTLVIPSA